MANDESADMAEAFNEPKRHRAVSHTSSTAHTTHSVHSAQHKRRGYTKILVAILILLFIAIGVVAFSANGAPSVSSATSFSLSPGSSTNFMVQNSSKTYTLYVQSASTAAANLYISAYPVLANPILSVTGAPGAAYNISTSGTGSANINLKIVSSNATSVKVQLTPIPVGLSIPASAYATVINPSPLPTSGTQTPATTTVSTTTVPTTTVAGSGSTTVTTAASTSTTTVAQVQVSAAIVALANATYLGALMSNLNFLYAKAAASCTAPLYNQSFKANLGYAAVPPQDYYNVSASTPTSYNTTISTAGSNAYVVKYAVTTPSKSNSGVVITYNLSSTGAVTNPTFSGIFAGANYTALESAYKTQAAISGPCAALIP